MANTGLAAEETGLVDDTGLAAEETDSAGDTVSASEELDSDKVIQYQRQRNLEFGR